MHLRQSRNEDEDGGDDPHDPEGDHTQEEETVLKEAEEQVRARQGSRHALTFSSSHSSGCCCK